MTNNIHALNPSRNQNQLHLEKLDSLAGVLPHFAESELHFDISDSQQKTDDKKRVIYNTRNNELVNVVGSKFRLGRQPTECVATVENMLLNSGLDLTGIKRRFDTSHDGGRYLVQYDLPAHMFDVGNGDEAMLQILHRNSYDGSWCFTIETGAVRMACTNGQVMLDPLCIYTSKHTKSLNPDRGSRMVASAISTYEREKERWANWKGQSVSNLDAFKILAKAAKFDVDPLMSLNEILASKKYQDGKTKDIKFLWNQYINHEQRVLGSNHWAVYNAMTHWSTHAEGNTENSKKNIASTRIDRRDNVRKACTLLKAA